METQDKTQGILTNEIERRDISLEVRGEADSRAIGGEAVMYNEWTTIGGAFEERIAPGAFTASLAKNPVIATFNHNMDNIVARTDSDTLVLEDSKKALSYRFDAPNTTVGNDLHENIRIKNVKGSSMMFRTTKQKWEWAERGSGKLDKRTVLEGHLVELGPVTLPAYTQTSATALRSMEDHESRAEKELNDAKEEALKSKNRTRTLQLQRNRRK